jgi:hypothetical protein
VVGNPTSIDDLVKHKVVIGPKNSDSYALSKKLFDVNNINFENNPNFIFRPRGEDIEAFLSGEADVLIVSGPFSLEAVKRSFLAGRKPFEIPNTDQYTSKTNFIKLTLPAGSMDVNRSIPSQDVNLLATTTLLVVKKDLEPGLQLGLLMTASKLIRKSPYTTSNKYIEFPAPMFDSLVEMSPTAKKYYVDGPPFLIKTFPAALPYWPF